MTAKIVGRGPGGPLRSRRYYLSNGWWIYTADSSQDWAGDHCYSLWAPSPRELGRAKLLGGADTLKAALALANQLGERQENTPR